MRNYLVLYQSEGALRGVSVAEMFARSSLEQLKAGMALWQAWHQKSGSAVVDLGAPLDKSTTLAADSAAPSKSAITGYSIMQANSIEDAVSLMKEHPHFHGPGSSIQILECVSMHGM